MSEFFGDLFNKLSGEEFDERPVDIDEFFQSPKYLDSSRDKKKYLSEIQKELIIAMSTIYFEETLIALHGERDGSRRYEDIVNEIIMQLGKGSGKDFSSCVAVAYVVYLCMCLKNPCAYFDNDSIDIINIAINGDQAQRVFFSHFQDIIENAPWFEGKFKVTAHHIEFDKKVHVYSGHSEREAYEGYNTLMVILDEISGFALTSQSGNEKAKTAPAIYDMYKGSVTSRFGDTGKLVLLSFPRFKDDFIQQKYKEVIDEKEVFLRRARLKVRPNLPDGTEGNEFEIEWEEDHIVSYKYPRTFALRRPSWECNPTKDLQRDYALSFYRNPGDAYGRFACMPSNLEDGFFKRMDMVKQAFSRLNGTDQAGVFHPSWVPQDDKKYFVHVDLAKKRDRCAVAIAHVEKWIQYDIGPETEEVLPVIRVDALRYWIPQDEVTKDVDFDLVIEFIKSVRRRGFDVQLATFDRWNSHDTMKDLNRIGIETDLLSVDKKHYDDFLITCYDERLIGPNEELLIDELGQLRQMEKGQKIIIEHPRTGYKDLSDAVCGAIFNAVAHTPREFSGEIEAYTLSDLKKQVAEEEQKKKPLDDSVIRAPKKKREMPEEIEQWLQLPHLL